MRNKSKCIYLSVRPRARRVLGILAIFVELIGLIARDASTPQALVALATGNLLANYRESPFLAELGPRGRLR